MFNLFYLSLSIYVSVFYLFLFILFFLSFMSIKVLIYLNTMNMHINMNMHWCIGDVMQWGKSCTHMSMHWLEYEHDTSK